ALAFLASWRFNPMASLLYAWEFGANFGHVGAFLPLARALRDGGHDVHWVVTQTAPAARLLKNEGFTWMQAPVANELHRPGPPLTYADILLRFGYADAADLLGLVVAWRELMQLTGARLVLADHGPTAMLAARTLGLPVMVFGNGFYIPPRQRPLPNMRPWQPLPEAQLLALEDEALASINAVLTHFGKAPLGAVMELFDVAEEALMTYPELDQYEDRGPARYWGCLPNASVGIALPWPDMPGKRVFAYLRPEVAQWKLILQGLQGLGVPTVVYFPNLPPHARARYESAHLRFADQPVDLGKATVEADVAITYSSLSTTTAFLLAGKPLLLMPSHLEQFLLARRVAQMGAGMVANPEQPPTDFLPLLRELIENDGYRENAAAFAAKYAAFNQDAVMANLVRRVGELCDAPKENSP
ncbi:MAG TPA: hypothetical protein VFW68_08580, partial [Rhodocyclaceae bacterium]|nr:hypothetical protein [Rhodocyclaceae bacterium]